MKKFQLLLPYYTLIVSTTLVLWAIFVNTKPESLILALLFLPCGLYFWLTAARGIKNDTPHDPKTLRTLFFALIISCLSSFVYAIVIGQTQITPVQTPKVKENAKQVVLDPKIMDELQKINTRLEKIEAGQKSSVTQEVLGTNSQIRSVTPKDPKVPFVDVYEEKSSSSKKIGQAEFGKVYLFLEKDSNWYLIFTGGQIGYIDSTMVKETIY